MLNTRFSKSFGVSAVALGASLVLAPIAAAETRVTLKSAS